ncbi:ankyrin repeat domain-containing protein [Algoriphagus halophytocola]|uniref:Ankyrin repeat domain-containing protein n=1 Tax=Algoriphagus halophytocola TaxID=2991499 RepID=A0ABY6MHM1_9BACT|nr:ankyrin repeat domain-containing protein [Algoriphagus sp. TR-M5]UZD23285.1 ankyrin repeat domain-containing protein [Algoriphagus sp. TR-M5]
MKTLKIQSLAMLVAVASVVIFTPACSQTTEKSKSETKAEAPDMDIHAAVLAGNLEVVQQHIKAGTDINSKEPFNGSTPLVSAATFGKTEIVKALLAAGADISIGNNDGSTPLHSAAFFGRVEIVQLLLDAEADKTVKNNYGATPRETVVAPFAELKPLYEMMKEQLGPLGFQLDMEELQKSRPVIAMMLQ